MATTAEVQARPAVLPAVEPTAAPASEAAPPVEARPMAASVEQPVSETPAAGAQTDVDPTAVAETGSMASEEAGARDRDPA